MRITKYISGFDPAICKMQVRGFFGNLKGEVVYANYGINMLGGKNGYFVLINGGCRGAATEFNAACNMLLEDLKIMKVIVV